LCAASTSSTSRSLLGRGEHADRALVDCVEVGRHRQWRAGGDLGGAYARHVAEHLDAAGLAQEGLGDAAERHPRRRLARAGPLEHRPGVVEAVLLHAHQVGVPGPRPGERGVARQSGQLVGSTGSALMTVDHLGHSVLPDPHRDRAALRDAVPDAAEELDLVPLERHPRAAAVAEPAAGQLVGDVGGGRANAGGEPLEHCHQGRAVGLPGGEPTQHGSSLPDAAVTAR
jgi:hypothetical protein